MISVCIPIYNSDVRNLVISLRKQAHALSVPCEIVLIDDFSNREFKKLNFKVCSSEKYIELAENIGRSRIRNLFADYVQYENLIFLDCDSLVISDNFLLNYVDAMGQGHHYVICGGSIYPSDRPSRKYRLRWEYGVIKESKSAEVRNQFPGKSFLSNNFLVDREILVKFPFDERISEYGHEDTLFGYNLKRNNIPVNHIDNPVLNSEYERNDEYLRKTEKSVANLARILHYVDFDTTFINDIALLRFYSKVKTFRFVIHGLSWLSKPFIVFLLLRGIAILWLFDFFKLGLLVANLNKKKVLYSGQKL